MANAELRYDAPLATFDCDEWNEFNLEVEVVDASTRTAEVRSYCRDVVDGDDDAKMRTLSAGERMMTSSSCSASSSSTSSPSSSSSFGVATVDDRCGCYETRSPNSGGNRAVGRSGSGSGDDDDDEVAFTGSLEDLVNCFDERIRNCFRNYDEQADRFAPVQIRTEEEVLKESQ